MVADNPNVPIPPPSERELNAYAEGPKFKAPLPERRLGRVFFSEACLEESWPEIAALLSGSCVVDVQRHFDRCVVEYLIFHTAFEVLERGEKAPIYVPTVHRRQAYVWVTWEKAKES